MTIRIDSMRTSLKATRELLDLAEDSLEVLYSLAYDRGHAVDEIRVRGGLPDYALDTHGDPAARAGLQALARGLVSARNVVAGAAHQAVRAVRDRGGAVDNTRSRTQITVDEFLESVEALERRLERGEFNPGRQANQPVPAGVEKRLRDDNKRLRKENQRLERRLAKLEAVK